VLTAPPALLDRFAALPAAAPLLGRLRGWPDDVFLVGGAVRDQMLGLEPTDLDLLVTGPVSALAGLRYAPYGLLYRRFIRPRLGPPAHTEAPATGSAILAGVLLKMGTYGFVRIAMPLLPATWRQYALVIVIIGVVSVVYGALVALAQTNVKRMIAYTSVNHMGYVVLGVGVAGIVAGSDVQARELATTGAVTQMVSHGLITGALFLLTGVLYDRGRSYDMGAYSGLAARTPVFATLFAVAAFASLGLPGFSGFIAEFQIFTGGLGAAPVPTAVAVTGILITAGLFLLAVQRLFLGPLRGREPELPASCSGYAANPMVQPYASLPAIASIASYLDGDDPVVGWSDAIDALERPVDQHVADPEETHHRETREKPQEFPRNISGGKRSE